MKEIRTVGAPAARKAKGQSRVENLRGIAVRRYEQKPFPLLKEGDMGFDAKLRWDMYFMVDAFKGGPVACYYKTIRHAYLYGSSVKEQEEKIQALIRHASETTPFYQNYAKETPLAKMPVITKRTVTEDYAAFASCRFKAAPGNRTMYTSGSTGTPFHVVQDRNKICHNTAASIFLGTAAGYYIGMKTAFLRTWAGDHKPPGRLSQIAENLLPIDCSHLDDAAIGDILRTIQKKKVEILIGYASVLGEMSRYIDRHGVDLSDFSVRAVIPISEAMPYPTRMRLREQFGCPVRSWYSNEENGIMGVQFESSNSYYIDSESYFYEILKTDSDEPAGDGELGRLVITDLYNFATPLIRYANGDMAIGHRSIKHGRLRFVIDELYGRECDVVYDTKGRCVSPFVLYNGFSVVPGLKQYRFIQEDEKRYRLILCGDQEQLERENLTARLRPYFGEDGEYTVEYTDHIPSLNSGKTRYIENRWKPQTSPAPFATP